MAIDNGPSITDRLTNLKYIKSSTQGYTFTKEGVEWLVTGLQEIYHEIEQLHKELDRVWSVKSPSSNINRSDECSQDDSFQPEQDE